jgi:ribosomal-protein-alanine N-acetyltransferase
MARHEIPYTVETMRVADASAVAALERLVFPVPWPARAFEYELRHNPMSYFVVVRPRRSGPSQNHSSQQPADNGLPEGTPHPSILGYGGFWFIVDEAHICTLAVHPDWRGRGLGELLLVRLIDRATQIGAAVVTLEVRASNSTAQTMYRKYGLVQTGLRKGYYSDNREDAIIMTTDLISSAGFQRRLQELKASLWAKLSSQKAAAASEEDEPSHHGGTQIAA